MIPPAPWACHDQPVPHASTRRGTHPHECSGFAGEDRSKRFAEYEALFGLQPTDFSKVENANKELQWHSNKWIYLHDFMKVTEEWYTGVMSPRQPSLPHVIGFGFRV